MLIFKAVCMTKMNRTDHKPNVFWIFVSENKSTIQISSESMSMMIAVPLSFGEAHCIPSTLLHSCLTGGRLGFFGCETSYFVP